jgi:hypothetical protein
MDREGEGSGEGEGDAGEDGEGDEAESGEGNEAESGDEDTQDEAEPIETTGEPFAGIDLDNNGVEDFGEYVPPPEDCSCIDVQMMQVYFDGDAMGYIKYIDPEGEEFEYPPNYGLTQCSAHDAMLEPTCADPDGFPFLDAPSWCADAWCFVNAETCTNGVIPSTYFPDDNLSYSYDVCAVAEDEAEEGDEEGQSGDEASGEDEASGDDVASADDEGEDDH